MVYATCRRILRNDAEAEDIAQECFETLARIDKAPKGYLGAWLHRVATNRALDRIKTNRRRRVREANFAEARRGQAEPAWDDIYEHVDEAIAALPDKYRVPLIAHYLEGQSHAAIALVTGVPRRTVTYRIGKGIGLVRKSLKKRGIPVTTSALMAMMAANLAEAAPIVPPSLTAVLGKLAMAGATNPAVTGTFSVATGAKLLGGLLVMKKLIVGVVVVVAGMAGIWAVARKPQPESIGPVREATPSPQSQVPARDESESEFPAQPVARRGVTRPEIATGQRKGVPVSGTVLLPQERPASGAQVIVYTKKPEFRRSGLTNDDGMFELTGFSAGSDVHLYAETDGFKSTLHGPVPLTEEGLADFRIELFALGGVRGVVVDLEGHPVPGAGVRANGGEKIPAVPVVYTDGHGSFAISDLVPESYLLSLIPPGAEERAWVFEADRESSVQVNPGEIRNGVTLVLDMGGNLTIAGRVTDTEGSPIANARVEIDRRSGGRPEWRTETDERGNYLLTGLSDTAYRVRAYSAGYAPRTQWDVAAGSEGVDLVLPRAQTTFAGRVVHADTGDPITEFEVLVVGHAPTDRAELRQYERFSFERVKDPEGRFEVGGFGTESGRWATVLARAPGFAMGYDTVRTGPDFPPVEALVQLEPEAAVKGIVLNSAEEPVPGAHILMGPLPDFPNIPEQTAAYSRDDGTFNLHGISSEISVISAYHPDYAPCSVGVFPRPGETESVRIVLSAGGIVEGMVTAGGEPLADAAVALLPQDETAEWSPNVRTDSGGSFRFTSVAPGSMEAWAYFPYARDEGLTRRLTRSLVVENGRVTQVNFDFGLATAALEGTVCYEDMPAKGGFARVYIASTEGEEFRSVSFQESTFRIEDLPAGPARVEISTSFPDFRNIVRRKVVDVLLNDNELTEITVDFGQGGRLGGVVTGIPPSEAWVEVFTGAVDVAELYGDSSPWDGMWGKLLVWQGSVDENGAFYAVGFDQGVYTVAVPVRNQEAATPAEVYATLRLESAIVELTDGQETWVEIPVR
jgi:RNA polymerase sigma factor (sigma-70 family)